MTDRDVVAAYLESVAAEATDRPRSLAADLLARALRRSPDEQPPAIQFVEQSVAQIGASDAETAAEVVYEIASIMAELQERFGRLPAGFLPQ